MIIITGQNLAGDESTSTDTAHDEDEKENEENRAHQNKPYRLIDEIQRLLIDDFYPPISSSTAPGNPGRLIIDISHLK